MLTAVVLLTPCATAGASELRDFTIDPVVVPEEAAAGPARIVSIAPSITEICAALGLADRIVGRTQYCTHPPAVAKASIVGAQVDLNLEQVVQLRPEIVLITAGSEAKLGGPLRKLGLRVETAPDQSIEDVFIAILEIGRACDRPQSAERLCAELREAITRLQGLQGDHRDRRILMTVHALPENPGPLFVAGPGSHLDQLLRLAGFSNAAADIIKRPWAEISTETLIAAQPDCIIEFRPADSRSRAAEVRDGWRRLSMIPAIDAACVRQLHDRTALIPGPRLHLALQQLSALLAD